MSLSNQRSKEYFVTFAITIIASLLLFFICIMCNSANAKTYDNSTTNQSNTSASIDELKDNKLVWTISPKLKSDYKVIPKNGSYTEKCPLIVWDPKDTSSNLDKDDFQWKFEFDSDNESENNFHIISLSLFKNISINAKSNKEQDDDLDVNALIGNQAISEVDITKYDADVLAGYNSESQQLQAQYNEDGTFSFFIYVSDSSSNKKKKFFLTVQLTKEGEVAAKKHMRFTGWKKDGSNEERKFYLNAIDNSLSTLRPNIKNQVNTIRSSVNGQYKPLTLAQFSDWHCIPESTDQTYEGLCVAYRARQNLARFYEYVNSADSPYIDDVLFSGDMVNTGLKENEQSTKKFVNSMWFVDSTSNVKYSGTNVSGKSFTPNNTLPTLGNHDVCIKRPGETTGKVEYTQQQLFDYFVGNHYKEMQLQGIDTSNPHVYYYKDYVEQNLRLITIDSLVKEDPQPDITGDEARTFKEQLVWLKEVLQDSAKNNISVVINTHCAPKQTKIEKGWWAFTPTWERTDICDDPTNGLSEKIMDVVQQFIDGTGEFQGLGKGIFAGYLGGHCHFARVVHSTNPKYSNQMFYLVGNADRKIRKDSRDVVSDSGISYGSTVIELDDSTTSTANESPYVDINDVAAKEYDNFCFVTFDTNNYEINITNAGRDTKSDSTYKFCSYPSTQDDITVEFVAASTSDNNYVYIVVAMLFLSAALAVFAKTREFNINN